MLAILLALATGAAAEDKIPDGLKPLAFMAGSCWDGPLPEFVGQSLGTGVETVSHCVRWDLENQVLRDSLRMEALDPPVRGETIYYVDSETKTVRYIFLSIGGSHSTGSMKVDGSALVFDDERLAGPSGISTFRTTWTPDGADAFVQDRQRSRNGGPWTNAPTSRFVKKPMR
ncbi:MAG: hypothetical protein FJX59_04670 [Alphaproteobacteria bacterium]|nr:hypothetical protein [Alphaproteobacteria bacterium]